MEGCMSGCTNGVLACVRMYQGCVSRVCIKGAYRGFFTLAKFELECSSRVCIEVFSHLQSRIYLLS